ncbi:MAG: DUF3784 domain-containing protein [Bacteroidales bacterium]|nr:DUF3784 domain-containing protein [Bacteroidales bacterium]
MGYAVLITGLVLMVSAWACFQYPNLINPYGSMPPERKESVNIEGLKKACAIILGATGFLMVVTAALRLIKVIDDDVCGVTLMVLVFAMLVPLFIAMKRYNAFGRDQSGKPVKSARASKIAWGFTWIVMAFAAISLVLSFRPTRITVGEETVKISGIYGREISVSDIVSVDLLDELPPIAMRTNGSETGKNLKGHFKLKSGEKCLVFVMKEPPYIELRTPDALYFLNDNGKEKTEALYRQLKQLKP